MKSNYINYVDYFNGELHKSHKTVNNTLVPDSKNRYVESITQQPISMLFDDRNKLIGYTFPMVDTHAFKKKFKPNEKYWIVKSEEGYFIADVQNDQWIYIKL
ncbi:hypothetical protein CD172_06850 [Staphylococcus agnetis]|nr:hypothetical protein [Staphylococcus agnetis]PNY85752.1 hypothetical protein CD172_06850 [Staphylococcus agnetis]